MNTDKLIKTYVKDCAQFTECNTYEDINGDQYTVCTDQDGGEWIEE